MDHPADGALPKGFRVLYENEAFEDMIGPILFRDSDSDRVGAFRAEARHCNGWGFVHGGMLTAFADAALTGIENFHRDDPRAEGVVTVSLNCEFVASVKVGDWCECRGEVVRRGASLVFMQGRLVVAGTVVMTCSTVLKRVRKRPDGPAAATA